MIQLDFYPDNPPLRPEELAEYTYRQFMNLQALLRGFVSNFDLPFPVPEYTVATLPSASDYDNHIIIVSDETGGRTIATSDGTNWCRVSDGATVS